MYHFLSSFYIPLPSLHIVASLLVHTRPLHLSHVHILSITLFCRPYLTCCNYCLDHVLDSFVSSHGHLLSFSCPIICRSPRGSTSLNFILPISTIFSLSFASPLSNSDSSSKCQGYLEERDFKTTMLVVLDLIRWVS